MAKFVDTLALLRAADDRQLARVLVQLKKAFKVPAPRQGFPVFLEALRVGTPKDLQQLLDQLEERYIEADPDKPPETRRERGTARLTKYLADEKAAGRPRPDRKAIEAEIRKTEGISDRQLQADLVEKYTQAVQAGLVAPRA